MAEGENSQHRQLDQTPTWAVAVVCAIMIIISLVLEKVIHKVGEWFTEKRKKSMLEALEKIKTELMVLGFISLLLSFLGSYIPRICIPENVSRAMLPCPYVEPRRKLLWNQHRLLRTNNGGQHQCNTGEPLLSAEGVHELHIFIFFLAIIHVFNSAITMLLGRLKIRGWKAWEQETKCLDYQFSHDPSRFRLTHETSFVKAHTSCWTRIPFFFYFASFFQQFFMSVRKADYLTLRHGFISVHLAPGSNFNFQKYIKRSLEDDFKVVVGISPLLWALAVVFLLINFIGVKALFGLSIIPLFIILAVGTKLQAIITRMALEIQERHAVVQGIPLVQLSDKHFWFGRPQLVLYLIHFVLFQNAFQITYFLWILYAFGTHSCFHKKIRLPIIQISLGVVVQVLCSYITLPLYSLVTQMGSNMKRSIFDEQTTKALKNWHMAAVKRQHDERKGRSPARTLGRSQGNSPAHHSPPRTLHRFRTTGHSNTQPSYSDGTYHSDREMSDLEAEAPLTSSTPSNLIAVQVRQSEHHDLLTGP